MLCQATIILTKIKDEGISEQVIAKSESLREERKLETERMIDREMYSVNS